MERTDLERKLSKRKSSSLWSRKSLRRSSTQQQPAQPASATQLTSPSTSSLARPSPRSASDHESADAVPPMPIVLSRSIVPDRLPELPAWYRENSNSVRYPMHNPVGPRWYKNHHLVAPASTRPSRPPSVFSPSFPPIASSGESIPTLSRSASNSPLPTPNSSQTQMENAQPRSRKTSQTARDNVDLLDVSDPWGAAWHHESPYDVGLSSSPASFEENAHTAPNHQAASRSRTSSVTTAQNRRKTVTPSPLSQSTSAVHLQVPERAQVSRRLSKRRTVGIFGGRHTAPTSPVDDSRGGSPASLGPPSSFLAPSVKSDRRGSVLGRLAKRFSILRKPHATVAPMQVTRQPSPEKRQPSPEKLQAPEPVKRVPPPLLHEEESFVVIPPPPESSKVEADRASSISLEAEVPYTMGRLTVANPDPGSVESTPVQRELSLPPEEREREVEHGRGASMLSMPSESPITMQGMQSPQSSVRSPEPVVSSSMSMQSQRPLSNNVVEPRVTSRAASPPPPPPEKPAPNTSDTHRREKSSSGPRAGRSSSPPSNRASSSLGRTQSPPTERPASLGRTQSPPTERPASLGRAQSPPTSKPLLEKPQPPPPASLPKTPRRAMTADISPLSVSSVLVNPPTPYSRDTPMPDDEPAPPPVPSKRTSRDPSPSQVSVTGRETETFRLVRSSSGNVYASSETIRAAGEQWEVMESSQDRESDSRREQRRQARADKEAESEQHKSRSHKRRSANSSGDHHRLPIPDTLSEKRKAERKVVDLEKPQPAPPPSRNLQRNPSKSARPTSELPTAADMNQMKAREAWDMDRLWKARSMGGMEANGVTAAPMPMPPAPVPKSRNAEDPPAVYGSSHTAFMVSTPFQQPASSAPIYHSMPPVPPPLVYPCRHASSSNGFSPRSNPLPEPPRESPYQPAPLTAPESYWGKHASATIAH
ncbi:hypothetical protein B0H14DRAFT_2676923 [Mycena olivaceomarginata]|nr:hypothetical protein B0H14DRAFT_2676923 [Mycena olivaceomarginata]